jgi:hypothetical protein
MKKLLFVVAIATIGLTTSCKKDCSTCSVKALGQTSTGGKTKEECDALKTAAAQSGGLVEVICD